jgi:hypothetical protein
MSYASYTHTVLVESVMVSAVLDRVHVDQMSHHIAGWHPH